MDMLACKRSVGKEQTRLYVVRLEERVFRQNRFCGVPGGKHSQDVLDGDAQVPNDGLAAEYVGAYGYPAQQLRFGAISPSPGSRISPAVRGPPPAHP